MKPYEQDNELSCSIKRGEFLGQLNDHQLLKKTLLNGVICDIYKGRKGGGIAQSV
jgi:hypothetical protein